VTGLSLVQRSPTMCLNVCLITETPKGALCSTWELQEKRMKKKRTKANKANLTLRLLLNVEYCFTQHVPARSTKS
jgi:hypothetical protein